MKRCTSSFNFFRFLCDLLARESFLYFNAPAPTESWRTLFLDLFKLRNIWLGDKNQFLQSTEGNSKVLQIGERFKVNVYVRFRPKRNEGEPSGRMHNSL